MSGDLRTLTSARGLAAWLVVLFHIRQSLADVPPGVMAVLDKGYLAVDFFFLLSGFVIRLAWQERLRERGWRGVPEFLRRRIARIWPLHLFMLAGAVLLALALAATGRTDPARFPMAELPLHALLIQNWGFTDALSWNDPAWSISCELGAYLLFPLTVFAIDWRRVPTVAVIAAILALCVLLHASFAGAGATTLGQSIPRLGLLRCVLEFAAGGAVCALWSRWQRRWRATAIGAAATAVAAGTLATAMETLFAPLAFAALLLALALVSGRRENPLEAPLWHWLGEISYATYLGHFLLWFAFKLLFVRAEPVSWPLVAAYLAAVLVVSAALHAWVERPAQRWINRLPLARLPVPLRAAPGSRRT